MEQGLSISGKTLSAEHSFWQHVPPFLIAMLMKLKLAIVLVFLSCFVLQSCAHIHGCNESKIRKYIESQDSLNALKYYSRCKKPERLSGQTIWDITFVQMFQGLEHLSSKQEVQSFFFENFRLSALNGHDQAIDALIPFYQHGDASLELLPDKEKSDCLSRIDKKHTPLKTIKSQVKYCFDYIQ